MADRLAALPLIHEPGTKWSYSISLDLLGRVIEVAAGQPFDVPEGAAVRPAGHDEHRFMVAPRCRPVHQQLRTLWRRADPRP